MRLQPVSWLSVTGLLVFGSVFLTWSLCRRPQSQLGRFEVYTEQGGAGKLGLVGIRDKTTKQPIWAEAPGPDGKTAVVVCCFQGKSVFELHIGSIESGKSLAAPTRALLYYDGGGKLKLMLNDRRGDGIFTDRVTYGEGDPLMEVWHDSHWAPIERRGGKNGWSIDGTWKPVMFTNGIWAVRSE
jgi:hypothetical protein